MTSERTAVETRTAERDTYLSPFTDFLVVLSITLLVTVGGVLLLIPPKTGSSS